MAVINLTAKQYKSGLKWSLVPINKIDTVLMQPLENTQSEESEHIHTENFTEGTLYQTDEVVALPISEDTTSSHWRIITDTIPNDYYVAKARVECAMLAGTKRITFDEALLSTPSVSISLTGKSYVVARGGSTFDSYPSIDDIKNPQYNITEWIKNNASSVNQSLTWNYEGQQISMNPFVRNWSEDKVPSAWKTEEESTVLPNDILTTWWLPTTRNPYTTQPGGVTNNDWQELMSESIVSPRSKRYMYPVGAKNGKPEKGEYIELTALYMYDININTYVGIRKIDDYNYQISWLMPARVSYCAATKSRWGTSGWGPEDIDNWAFVDEISAISVNIEGQPLSDDTVDVNFSLDQNGSLTEFATNRHPLLIDKSEAFTLGTKYGSTPWTEELAQGLLEKYENGKYVVECDVGATWALRNLVHVGTEMYVYLLDGRAIKRDGEDCLFSVKNIEKQFNNNEFIFRLKLMEV